MSKKKRKRKLGETLTKVHSEKSKSRDRLVQKETERMLGVTLTKVHSEKSKSRDRLVQKETKENAWGDRSVR